MSLSVVDTITLLLYFSGVMALGFYFSKKNDSTEEYFVGGRRFSGWVIGLSLVGTSISSVTFLSYPGDAYKTAWLRFLPNFMLPVAVLIATLYFIKFFRDGKTTTAYEFLERRYSPSVRVYGSVAFMVAQLVRISTILYLVSLLMHEITGWDVLLCIFITGLLVAIYTVVGGIDAVIWTDVIQTLVLVGGGIICSFTIVAALPGGMGQIFEVAGQFNKLSFSESVDGSLRPVSWDLSLLNKTATMMLVLGLTQFLTEYCANQNVVQRYCAAQSTAEAKKAAWICALSSLPIWAFYMFLGTALFAFYQVFPATDAAAMLSGEQKAEQILPYYIVNQLPVGVAGLVIAAALAAAMSSLDSSINAISACSVVDIYKRHINKNASDNHYLKAAWLVAGGVSLFMIVGAIYINASDTKTLQDLATILASLLGGGLLSLYLIGFFSKRGDARAAWAGIVATVLFTAWTLLSDRGYLPEAVQVPFDLYYTAIIGNVVMFVVVYSVALILGQKPEAVEGSGREPKFIRREARAEFDGERLSR